MKKILVCFGTRPEAIKLMPLITELKNSHEFVVRVLWTGQHKEMVEQVLHSYHLTPDFQLDVMEPHQTLTQLTGRLLEKLHPVFGRENPDLLLVQGDTTSTFAGALAAFYHKISVGHVEAGLRTSDKYSPFPEEINRRMTTTLADLHFAPTRGAEKNLRESGVDPKRIFLTGNTGVDAILAMRNKVKEGEVAIDFSLKNILAEAQSAVTLITLHRRENFGPQHKQALLAIRKMAQEFPQKYFIFPVHLNPAVRKPVFDLLSSIPNMYLLDPLDYPSLVAVLAQCELVVTDSGGLQEECPSFRIPTLVLRETTERPEAVEAGFAKLVGTNASAIEREMRAALTDQQWRDRLKNRDNPFGDGTASQQIVQVLRECRGKRW